MHPDKLHLDTCRCTIDILGIGISIDFQQGISISIGIGIRVFMWDTNCKIAQAFFLLSCRGLGLGVKKLMGVSHVSNFLLGSPKNLLLQN